MKKDGTYGGSTKSGLIFEGKTDLATFLSEQKGYRVDDKGSVFYDDKLVARLFKKYGFYSVFLKELGIDWADHISRRLLPDDSIYVVSDNRLFIIECKHQETEGSTDEKLQTCDFKKKEYQKLLSGMNIKVEYYYLLDEWFKDPKYEDVLDYIRSMGCDYYFNQIPIEKLGLPAPGE